MARSKVMARLTVRDKVRLPYKYVRSCQYNTVGASIQVRARLRVRNKVRRSHRHDRSCR